MSQSQEESNDTGVCRRSCADGESSFVSACIIDCNLSVLLAGRRARNVGLVHSNVRLRCPLLARGGGSIYERATVAVSGCRYAADGWWSPVYGDNAAGRGWPLLRRATASSACVRRVLRRVSAHALWRNRVDSKPSTRCLAGKRVHGVAPYIGGGGAAAKQPLRGVRAMTTAAPALAARAGSKPRACVAHSRTSASSAKTASVTSQADHQHAIMPSTELCSGGQAKA